MKKPLILTIIFVGFMLILFFCFGKKQENTDIVNSAIERNEIEPSSPSSRYEAILHENLFESEKGLEESKPIEEEKEEIVLEKSEASIVDDIRGEEDSNGVRHDVNLWIAEQPITYDQKLALIQLARSMQADLVNVERISQLDIENGRKEAEILAVNLMKSMGCIMDKFKDETDPFAYSYSLEKLIFNSENRIKANQQFDHALSGAAIIFPEGDPCAE